MCSTIRSCRGAHYFNFLQTKHFCKAPTISFDLKFTLGYLLTPSLRFGRSECARPTAPVQGPTASISCKPSSFVNP